MEKIDTPEFKQAASHAEGYALGWLDARGSDGPYVGLVAFNFGVFWAARYETGLSLSDAWTDFTARRTPWPDPDQRASDAYHV